MIVCQCRGITDRTIQNLVRQGACSLRDIGRACDAGRGCGGCRPTIHALVEAKAAKGSQLETPRLEVTTAR